MDQRDHDLLIKLTEQMIDFKEQMIDFKGYLTKIEQKVDKQNDTCHDRMQTCGVVLDSKVNNSWFKWIIVGMLTVLLSVAGIVTTTRIEVGELAKEVAVHQAATAARQEAQMIQQQINQDELMNRE